MATFSPPPYRFPIGFFHPPGQRDPVEIYPDKAFWDYLANVFDRIGGESGLSTGEIVALIAAEAASQRRPANNPPPEIPPIPRSNSGEVQALRDRVQSLESQLRAARSEQAATARAVDDLRTEMRRMPSLAALERRLSDLEAVTL
jgi:hypothetical protein